jgi:glycosyltransferase involved in cell wall biosynthesis
MQNILVSHPHATAFAQKLVAGLQAAGRLGAFFTGVAANPGSTLGRCLSAVGCLAPQVKNRLLPGADESRLYSFPAVEMGARSLARLGRALGASWSSEGDCMYVAHDAAVSVVPWPSDIDGIYAYEDGALKTFRRAMRRDLPRVWDLPLPHYAILEQMWIAESTRWPGAMGDVPPIEPAWKKGRKDEELSLATHISVASHFTQESLDVIDCRLPIFVTPYGFPVDTFLCKERIADGPFTALAVGSHNLRKGTPYLLEAWKRAGLKSARLRLIGPMGLTARFLEPYRGIYEHVPYLPKARLAAEYCSADVVVFPTLGDGFGLIIQEAMCCGTPVITTRCGGGPECIKNGQDGWIIPERSIDALVETLRIVAADRQSTFAVGRAARSRAERYTWNDAGAALASFLGSV